MLLTLIIVCMIYIDALLRTHIVLSFFINLLCMRVARINVKYGECGHNHSFLWRSLIYMLVSVESITSSFTF